MSKIALTVALHAARGQYVQAVRQGDTSKAEQAYCRLERIAYLLEG